MSADNWDFCPACQAADNARLVALEAKIQTSYGKIPIEEFDGMRAELAAGPTVKQTFREDYEIGVDGGEVYVSYRGHCSVPGCGCGIDFKDTRKFWPPPLD